MFIISCSNADLFTADDMQTVLVRADRWTGEHTAVLTGGRWMDGAQLLYAQHTENKTFTNSAFTQSKCLIFSVTVMTLRHVIIRSVFITISASAR